MDRKFIITALAYAIIGMCLGIYMAKSGDHGHRVSHAHIMLAGFVVSFIYGLCHKLWLPGASGALVQAQFWLHQVGVLMMSLGLFLLYGQHIAVETIDPMLAISSLMLLLGMVLMLVLFIRAPATPRPD
ncbi:TonB-dependent receptor [Shewanella sp. 3B26]|uniref:TonB-dependent receptor n=1 Tax=Shewanella zhuhaiensis TaxID=2919576 RepID=A0AAJ1F004_9GAMM|nr:TonB-dependent receptor [Shewanella zhuhaiensis]MCH4294591.1 TonB-dependent receptor [Shewanella zhuhaiensis]